MWISLFSSAVLRTIQLFSYITFLWHFERQSQCVGGLIYPDLWYCDNNTSKDFHATTLDKLLIEKIADPNEISKSHLTHVMQQI